MYQIEAILLIVFLGQGQCQDDEIKDKDNNGACTKCLLIQVPNANKDECIDCGANEITNGNTKCEACPQGETANTEKTKCEKGMKSCIKPLVPD